MSNMEITKEFIARTKEMQDALAGATMDESKKHMMEHGNMPGSIIGFDSTMAPVVLMPFGFNSPEDRQFQLKLIRLTLMIKRVILYVISHEAWAKTFVGESLKDVDKHRWGDLEKDPDRTEVISVMVVSRFLTVGRATEIHREGTKIIEFKDLDTDIELEGDLANLIQKYKGEVV